MPNKKGGKKFKKGKKGNNISTTIIYKDPKEGQEYAQIKGVHGSRRYKVFCFDGIERLGIAAGNIRKTKILLNDIVLISKWDFQDSKCSIVFKYDPEHVNKLKSSSEFPANLQLNEFEEIDAADDIFDYSLPDNISDEDEENAIIDLEDI